MNVHETLDRIKQHAKTDPAFLQALLHTKHEKNSLSVFCRLCSEAGFPVSAMDMVAAGEEAYAAMRRSTNGGGENSPLLVGEDDLYELFLIELEAL